jgi:hypothetical protein
MAESRTVLLERLVLAKRALRLAREEQSVVREGMAVRDIKWILARLEGKRH